MVTVQYRTLPAFEVAGVKRHVTTVEDFAAFWQDCHADQTIAHIRAMQNAPGPVTGAWTIGVSRVEKDPHLRSFFFYIAGEIALAAPIPQGFERFTIPTCTWAVCTGAGEMMRALYEAEMHAFTEILKEGGKWRHAPAPELEVYPADGETVQFWLPVERVNE